MRRRGLLLAAIALSLGLLAAMPPTVSACISEQPTFIEAVRGAHAIARVTIVEGWDGYPAETESETFRVERILKGTLPEVVTRSPAWSSLCHDSVASFAGAEESDGKVIVVAFDMPYFDQTLQPMWISDDHQGVRGSAGVPPGITTLAALEAAILAELALPQTTAKDSAPASAAPLALVVAAAVAAFAISLRSVDRLRRGIEAIENQVG